MKSFLILEDGTIYEGTHFGARKEVVSEIVFNTSMAGYLEVLTDPSYAGQAVCMTYPLIGNYGVRREDMESSAIWPDALIVRELSDIDSNFRSDLPLEEFLKEFNVPGIQGIDTRALTKRLREHGTMNGMITTKVDFDVNEVIEKLKGYSPKGVVKRVSCKEKYEVMHGSISEAAGIIKKSASFGGSDVRKNTDKILKVALLDFGAKKNIPLSLAARGCDVTVFPCDTKAEEILNGGYDGIMLSNGPGDPKECTEIIAEIKKLYDSDMPIFAICLGHQLMALATGANTYKLKYGHRGANHPVKDLETKRVYISSQNHGYVVDMESLDPNVAEPAFINVNDGTNEGLKYIGKNIFTVQFHPENCPGPQDSEYLFDRFINMMLSK